MKPPVAKRFDERIVTHGHERVDPYAWLRRKDDDPDVLAYLAAENAHAESRTSHTATLRQQLFDEMLARIQEDDVEVPYRRRPFWYYQRTTAGRAYPIWCRCPWKGGDPPDLAGVVDGEQVLLDENALAEGHEYHRLGSLAVSPDHRLVAYCTDDDGSERFRLRIREASSGDVVDEVEGFVYYGLGWANDNATLFYVTLDAAHRPWRVHRHRLGQGEDAVVWQEADETLFVHLSRMRSGRFLRLSLDSHTTSEVAVLDADDPQAPPRVVAPRRKGVEVGVDHTGDRFVFWTNHEATNFRVLSAPVTATGPEQWQELIPHDPDVHVLEVDALRRYLVVSRRVRGMPDLLVLDLENGTRRIIGIDEPSYALETGPNAEFDTDEFRFTYESPVTPPTVVDVDLTDGTRRVRKVQPVLGGYDPSRYAVERFDVPAPDGVSVPVTLVTRNDAKDPKPLWLRGYGAYGFPYDARFSSTLLSLLDRGVAAALAHVRGGGDLGRPWYQDGKLAKKENTFGDFLAVAEALKGRFPRICAYGGSAGGMTMGVAANRRPDLFEVIVADVPFVDCLNSMLDATLPLTVIEWEEWGNPVANEADYRAMLAYSPFENVAEQAYPHLLVLAGLNDPRVGYWEPAKWVARLRAAKTDDHELVLKTNMGAGHGGKSGRYGRLEDTAYIYAFVLDRLTTVG